MSFETVKRSILGCSMLFLGLALDVALLWTKEYCQHKTYHFGDSCDVS